jgi:alkanesulfonate monooxygenase SsuD/methylene tetrahydromethanopterin reductase-like flavin-dependent oxidoreductase (luciferase family)
VPGLSVIVAATDEAAREDFEHLQSLIHPIVAREILSLVLGNVDLSAYPLDGPFPENLPLSNASQSTFQYVIEMARNEKLPLMTAAAVVYACGRIEARGERLVAL